MLSIGEIFQIQKYKSVKSKRMEKISHANSIHKLSGYNISKIDFNTKNVTRDKEEHFVMISHSIRNNYTETITIINIYACSNSASNK